MARRFRFAALIKIASGGTATVYVGARGVGHELVALKRPHAHVLDDPRQRAEVMREAGVAQALRHPNVVGVRDVETLGDEIQLVMDYVEGSALGALIALAARQEGRLPVGVTVRIVLDACAGLAAVHAQRDASGNLLGLVHRDVSPQNILVGLDGRSRVTDFGLAKAVYAGAPSTTQGTLKGKLGYMAPEYVSRGEVDGAVDIFAMGVVLWEALAGRRLFRGDNEAQTLDRVLRETPAALSAVDPELAPFDPVVARATAKDPARRFGSALDLAAALSEVADGRVATWSDVARYVHGTVGAELTDRRARVSAALRARRRAWWIGAAGAIGISTALAVTALLVGSPKARTPGTTSNLPSSDAPSAAPAGSGAPASSSAPVVSAPRTEVRSGQVPGAAATVVAPTPTFRPRPARSAGPLPPNPYDRPR